MANAKKNQMGISFFFSLEDGKSLRNISNGAQYMMTLQIFIFFPHIQVFSYLLLVLFQPHTLG